jgi:hypothetical protein
MEIFREFGINDTEENIKYALQAFIQAYPSKWHYVDPPKEMKEKFIIYKYKKSYDLTLRIFLVKTEHGIRIANILPDKRNSITKKEYNEAVMDFYNDLVKIAPQYENKVTTNQFDPLQIMSKEALEKLRDFYFLANKSTGSSHHDDEQRWYAFICQTVEDKKIITAEQEFLEFLQDKEYWGIDVFEEDVAFELLHEYNKITGCLKYYINITRG